ncbi:MAG: hypothetical protein ABWX93_10515 [Pseudoxanthomonas sp.]
MPQACWPGWSAARTLVLPMPVEAWAPPIAGIMLEGVEFEPKPELHVTLVGGALGRELHAAFGTGALERATRAALDAQDWSFTRPGRRLLLQKAAGGRGNPKVIHSVIECIHMPAMARFHAALGVLLGRQLTVPPPHVTLFTAGKAEGIGVASARQLRGYLMRDVICGEPAERA